MGNVPYLDFQAIKRSYSIEEIMTLTGLQWKKDGAGYRTACPVHKGGPRSLAVSPGAKDDKGDDGVFFCHAADVGGDRVALLAHVRDSKPYAVFKELAEKRATAPAAQPEESQPAQEEGRGGRGFRPLPYLDCENPAVLALGIPPEIAKATGLGFAPRGLHRGRVAIPLRQADGAIVGYISIEATTVVQTPPQWNL